MIGVSFPRYDGGSFPPLWNGRYDVTTGPFSKKEKKGPSWYYIKVIVEKEPEILLLCRDTI